VDVGDLPAPAGGGGGGPQRPAGLSRHSRAARRDHVERRDDGRGGRGGAPQRPAGGRHPPHVQPARGHLGHASGAPGGLRRVDRRLCEHRLPAGARAARVPRAAVPRHRDRREHAGALRGVRARVARDGRPDRRRLLCHDTGPHRGDGPGRPESQRRALMKRNIGAFVALLAIAIAAVGPGVAAPRGTLTIGIPTDVNTLDPSLSPEVNTENVIFSTMEPLLYLDLQGNVQPRLAESWQVVDSTTYVFKLRKNVKFHNGEPLTGQAVEYSWKRSQEKHRVNRTAFGSV